MTKEYVREMWLTHILLEDFKESIFERMCEFAINGELSDFLEDFPLGTEIEFKVADFKNLDDPRIKDLYELFYIVDKKVENIKTAFDTERNLNPDFDDLPF